MRAGLEDQDWPRLAASIRALASEQDGGCWRWTRQLRNGYPVADVAGRRMFVHRLSLMAHLAADLGSQPVHHRCANTACVNPEHLQPVTHRENIAEMLARRAYLARISELEAVVRELAPEHPALAVVPYL